MPARATKVQAVFFDAVGTLLHPEPDALNAYVQFAARHGLQTTRAALRERFLTAYHAEERIDQRRGWITSEEREHERWKRIVIECLPGLREPDSCFRALYEHFATPAAWRIDADATATISELHNRGFTLGMGSNYDARLVSVLDGFPELAPLREHLLISAAVGYRKPATEFFRAVMGAANCEPDRIVFVGDDVQNDYHGATAAGLFAVLLNPTLPHPTGVASLRSLRELPELLGV